LGSVVQMTDGNQNVVASYKYDAWGNDLTDPQSQVPNPFKYVGGLGYYSDKDSGLKLLGVRYYDSQIGRFWSLDPIKEGRNWYGYAKNNPVVLVDPTGLQSEAAVGGVIIVICLSEPTPIGEIILACCLIIAGGAGGVILGEICYSRWKDKPLPSPPPLVHPRRYPFTPPPLPPIRDLIKLLKQLIEEIQKAFRSWRWDTDLVIGCIGRCVAANTPPIPPPSFDPATLSVLTACIGACSVNPFAY